MVNYPLTFIDIPVFNPVAVKELGVTAQSVVPVADIANEGGVSPAKRLIGELGIPENVIAPL